MTGALLLSLGAAAVATGALSFGSVWLSNRSAARLDRRAAAGTGAGTVAGGYDGSHVAAYSSGGSDGCSSAGGGSDGCST